MRRPSRKPRLALLLVLFPLALASRVMPQNLCTESCRNCLRSVRFNDTDPTASNFVHSCRSRLALSSTYLCHHLNCGTQSGRLVLQERNATCQRELGVPIPPWSVIANFTPDDIAHIRRITKDDLFDPEQPLSEVVAPSPEFFIAWFETLDAWSYARKYHARYGLAVAAFWVIVVAIGIVNRIYLALCRARGLRRMALTRIPKGMPAWLKRHLLLPATFGYTCAQTVWWSSIPPRIQSLTILAFLIVNVIFTVHGYKVTSENFYFPTVTDQLLRVVSDRAGILSFLNFPVIWLFGVRNNVALWLTGWDFGTYNNFHRWCARIATVEAVIHSIGYFIIVIRDGGMTYLLDQMSYWYWNAGILATAFMCLLLPCSIYWMRSRHYETFLIVHIVLSILLLLTMLGHISIFKGKFTIFVQIPTFIWLLDRMMRLFRVIGFNPQSWSTNALVANDASANVVRLSVPISNWTTCKPRPGTFYYLMVLDDARCWEGHPFTVASVSTRPPMDPEDADEQTTLLYPTTDFAEPGNDDAKRSGTESGTNHMTFLIRPYDSFTARLRDLAADSTSLKVLVEGAYGHTHSLHKYDHVVFIVGGTGVITPLSYLSLLVGKRDGPTSVELHWAVREAALAQTVMDSYLDIALRSNGFSLDLYMSSRSEPCASLRSTPGVRQHPRRPDIPKVVAAAVVTAHRGSVAVVACGPEQLVDDARLAVVNALKDAECEMDYFQESFSW